MGKYDSLKGKLPAFEQESSFQQKVDEAKIQYQKFTTKQAVSMLASARRTKRSYEKDLAAVNIELEALSQLLVENFEASGLTKLSLETGETCYTQTEPYSSIQDQAALLASIKKQKMSNLLTLQWSTMNAMNKERLIAGKPPLPGTVVFLKTSMRLRGGTDSGSE